MAVARPVFRDKQRLGPDLIVERVVWELSSSVPPSIHRYKYRLFFGRPGQRLIGYDNERGKGDHRHYGDAQDTYAFTSVDQLLSDFGADVEQ